MNETLQTVGELLRSAPVSIEAMAKAIGKHPRSVYRAVETLKDEYGFEVVRYGDKGDYRYFAPEQDDAGLTRLNGHG